MKTRQVPGKSAKRQNGFALEPALLVFTLVLMLAGYAALSIQSSGLLLQAAHRSEMDLAVIERAKRYAGECSWARRCSTSAPPSSFLETIENIPVTFKDETTLIQASYTDRDVSVTLELYYDSTGIIRVEYR